MSEKTIYIFGAHSRARTLKEYLTTLEPEVEVGAFIVDNDEENPPEIEGVPVVRPLSIRYPESSSEGRVWTEDVSTHGDTGVILNTDAPVYIATRGVYHEHIQEVLKVLGFKEIIPVTPGLDTELRNAYLRKRFRDENRLFDKIDDYEDCCVYVAKSVYDTALKDKYVPAPYEKLIHVGAVLTEERLAECLYSDDEGDNISARNRQFCELTALYWIWKNAEQHIVGLAHYRRHFILPDDWQSRMEHYGIDVILPTPLCVMPALGENYRVRHSREDFDYLMDYCAEHMPEDYPGIQRFFEDNLYSPCNMFIMRKEALEDYCAWVFPVLFAMVDHIGQKDDVYQNRYPGFMAERLMSYFFESRRDRYKVVYSDKTFLN